MGWEGLVGKECDDGLVSGGLGFMCLCIYVYMHGCGKRVRAGLVGGIDITGALFIPRNHYDMIHLHLIFEGHFSVDTFHHPM